jgi:uncharacterized RDD family membrane protein YckC
MLKFSSLLLTDVFKKLIYSMPIEPEINIPTPENIHLHLELAGLGSRGLAYLLDTIIRVGLLGALFLLFYLLNQFFHLWKNSSKWMIVFLVIPLFLLHWFYFVLFEAFRNGQTPGKKVLRIRVIKEGGYPIGFLESVIRNLLRIVDFLPAAYLLGICLIFVNKRHQRLGDMAAGTVVIREQSYLPIVSPEGETGNFHQSPYESLLARIELNSQEYELIARFLQRRAELDPSHRGKLRRQLIQSLFRRHNINFTVNMPNAPGIQEEFLEHLLGFHSKERK